MFKAGKCAKASKKYEKVLPYKELVIGEAVLLVKRIKYEIRLGKPNRPIDEPNGPMSTSPKKVEPILRVSP